MASVLTSAALIALFSLAYASAFNNGNHAALQAIQKSSGLPAIGYIILDNGKVKDIQAAGLRRTNGTANVSVDDKWHIGSCGKVMTATVLARLIEQGYISWNTTLSEVFSNVSTGLSGATVRQLLTHTSGLPRDFPVFTFLRRTTDLDVARNDRKKFVADALRNPPQNASGTVFQYSNVGYTVAGRLAEKVTGRAWHVLLREQLFGPLGINGWGIGSPGIGNPDSQPWGHIINNGSSFLFGFEPTSNTSWTPVKPGRLADFPPFMAPAGTLHISMREWARFAHAHLLGGSSGLLRQSTFDELHRPELQGYAAGWNVSSSFMSVNNTRVWSHAGSNAMNVAVASLFPEWNQAILMVTNAVDFPRAKMVEDGLSKVFKKIIAPQLGR